jgi:hypothetical protein
MFRYRATNIRRKHYFALRVSVYIHTYTIIVVHRCPVLFYVLLLPNNMRWLYDAESPVRIVCDGRRKPNFRSLARI